MSDTLECFRCDTELSKDDEWWSHSWNEQPAKKTVEEKMERGDDGKEMRDWFNESIILCPGCHKLVAHLLQSDSDDDLAMFHNAVGQLLQDVEHDNNGEYMGIMSDGDMFKHDNPFVVFAYVAHMFDGTDYLTGDLNVAVTIGPSEAIEKPTVDNSHIHE